MSRKRIHDQREGLLTRGRKLEQCRRVKRFGVTPRRVSAPIYLGSTGCQRTDTFGFCASYVVCAAGNDVLSTGEVFWLNHCSRSAKSTSKL